MTQQTERESALDRLAEALGDSYDCTRVWSAWGVGTMSQDDFILINDDSDRLNEILDHVISPLLATIAQQSEALEAARKDAERYRCLRGNMKG